MVVIANPNGSGFIDAPEEKPGTNVMFGADGKLYTIPTSSYDIAIQNGWKPVFPKASEASVEDNMVADAGKEKEAKIVAKEKEKEESPWTEAFNQFADEASLGIKPYIQSKNRTPEENEIEEEAEKRYTSANPIKSYAAKGAGFLAPLALPVVGEAGEAVEGLVRGGAEAAGKLSTEALADAAAKATVKTAAEQSLTRKLAATSAKYATEGALYSTPLAATQVAYGDPNTAAETMLWGVGLSGVLGAGTELLGTGARAAKNAIGEAAQTGLRSLGEKQANGITYSDDLARNNLGISDKLAKKLGPAKIMKIVETADQEGILSASVDKKPAMIKEMLADSGKKIGEHLDTLDNINENYGSRSGNIKDVEDMLPTGSSAHDIATEFQQQVLDKHPELQSELHSDVKKFAEDIKNEIQSGGIDKSFSALKETRRIIDKSISKFDADTPKGEIVRLADSIIKKHEEIWAQALFNAGEAPERFADYVKQKGRYSAGLELSKGINEFKGTGKLPFSLKKLGFGFTEAFALATGHPLVALGYAAKHVLGNVVKNEYLGKGASWLRKAAQDPASAPIIGNLLAKAGNEALDSHISSMPSILSGAKVIGRTSAGVVQHLVGNTTGMSNDSQYNKLVDTINSATVNKDFTARKVGAVAGVFSSSMQLASLVADKKLAAINYLQSQIPKDTNPPKAFQKNNWKPTTRQKQEFLQKVAVVNDPMIVWNKYQAGTLTKIERDALIATYPAIYQKMVDKINLIAYDPREKPLTSDQTKQLAMFTQNPNLDSNLRILGAVQKAVQPTTPPQQNSPSKPSRAPKFEHSPSLMTEAQRIQNKQ